MCFTLETQKRDRGEVNWHALSLQLMKQRPGTVPRGSVNLDIHLASPLWFFLGRQ